jgi:Uma2 family endonuclease
MAMPQPFRWSREAFVRAAEAGAFDDRRVELIAGEVVEMGPVGPLHAAVDEGARDVLAAAFAGPVHARTEKPLELGEWDQPQPDVAVVIGVWRDYLAAHPTVEQALLVVEIGDATLAYDTGRKARVYAAAGIDDYWVIDPNGRRVSVFRHRVIDPMSDTGWRYAERTDYGIGQTITPLRGDARPVAVDWLLP